METTRRWLHTCAWLGIAIAGLIHVIGGSITTAHADTPPTCATFQKKGFSGKTATANLTENITTFVSIHSDRDHWIVVPFGRISDGSGSTGSIVCAW